MVIFAEDRCPCGGVKLKVQKNCCFFFLDIKLHIYIEHYLLIRYNRLNIRIKKKRKKIAVERKIKCFEVECTKIKSCRTYICFLFILSHLRLYFLSQFLLLWPMFQVTVDFVLVVYVCCCCLVFWSCLCFCFSVFYILIRK